MWFPTKLTSSPSVEKLINAIQSHTPLDIKNILKTFTLNQREHEELSLPTHYHHHLLTPASTSIQTISNSRSLNSLLPDEVLILILSFVAHDTASISRAALVCKKWNSIIKDHQLWRSACSYRGWKVPYRRKSSLVSLMKVPRMEKEWRRIFMDHWVAFGFGC